MRLMQWTSVCAALLAVASLFSSTNLRADEPVDGLRVMSFNIRLANNGDGENRWDLRKETLVDVVKSDDPHLLGVQEALPGQMDYLNAALTEYASIGVGRDDGKRKGEFMAIFYKKDALELLDSGTFWLSQTPDKPGVKGWDAECNRTVTWGKFRCKKTGKEFAYANTHFDHVGTIARKESAKLILRKLDEIIGADGPFFVSGDFNVTDQSEAYRVMTTGVDDIPGLKDSNKVAKVRDIAQPRTFNNFNKIPVEKAAIIDFIFVNGKCVVEKFEINPDLHRDPKTGKERPASDHNSIMATLTFVD